MDSTDTEVALAPADLAMEDEEEDLAMVADACTRMEADTAALATTARRMGGTVLTEGRSCSQKNGVEAKVACMLRIRVLDPSATRTLFLDGHERERQKCRLCSLL